MSDAEEFARARRLFEDFHGRAPTRDEIIKVGGSSFPTMALLVGSASSILYRARGEEFMHDFHSPRPQLYVTPNGRQMFLIGGVYTFTDRGFIK